MNMKDFNIHLAPRGLPDQTVQPDMNATAEFSAKVGGLVATSLSALQYYRRVVVVLDQLCC